MPFGDAKKRMFAATVGLAAPVLAFTCILVAIASYSKFSWTGNALSDLGVVKGLTGPLFNFGLYASGFLGVIFAVLGLYPQFGKSVIGKAGALTFAATSAALIAIGVFNESFSGIHVAVSAAFFVLAPIGLYILTCAFALNRQTGVAVFTLGVGIAAAAPWILEFTVHYVPEVAIPETISAIAISVWTIYMSYRIAKQTNTD